MNAFYRFIIGLCASLLLVAAVVSYLGELYRDAAICAAACAALVLLWEKVARQEEQQ